MYVMSICICRCCELFSTTGLIFSTQYHVLCIFYPLPRSHSPLHNHGSTGEGEAACEKRRRYPHAYGLPPAVPGGSGAPSGSSSQAAKAQARWGACMPSRIVI